MVWSRAPWMIRWAVRCFPGTSYGVEGIVVYDTIVDEHVDGRREQMESAIGAMRRFAPRAWRWLRERRLPIVIDNRGSVRYAIPTRMIYFSADIVIRSSPVVLAMLLVHEVRHARVRRLGVPLTPENAGRIEALSFSAEREFVEAFAKSDPDGAEALGEWVNARQRAYTYETTKAMTEHLISELSAGWRPVVRMLSRAATSFERMRR